MIDPQLFALVIPLREVEGQLTAVFVGFLMCLRPQVTSSLSTTFKHYNTLGRWKSSNLYAFRFFVRLNVSFTNLVIDHMDYLVYWTLIQNPNNTVHF